MLLTKSQCVYTGYVMLLTKLQCVHTGYVMLLTKSQCVHTGYVILLTKSQCVYTGYVMLLTKSQCVNTGYDYNRKYRRAIRLIRHQMKMSILSIKSCRINANCLQTKLNPNVDSFSLFTNFVLQLTTAYTGLPQKMRLRDGCTEFTVCFFLFMIFFHCNLLYFFANTINKSFRGRLYSLILCS